MAAAVRWSPAWGALALLPVVASWLWLRPAWTGSPLERSRATVPQAEAGGLTGPPVCTEERLGGGRIIVVGAGLAGLTAAQSLRRAGCASSSLLVLEAGAEAGGRARSFKDGPFQGRQRGAHWVHAGEENAVITALCRFFNLSHVFVGGDDAFEGSPERRRFFRNGLQAPELLELALARFKGLDFFTRIADFVSNGSDISILEAWDRLLERENLSEADRELLDFVFHVQSEQTRGLPPHEVGLHFDMEPYLSFYPEEGNASRGGDTVLRGGYEAILARLAEGIDIRYGVQVRAVEHSEAGVVLRTDTEDFAGAAAIVTVPLGVLKAGDLHFRPALPPEMDKALRGVAMSECAKVFVRFRPGRSPVEQDGYLLVRQVPRGQHSLAHYCVSAGPLEIGEPPDVLECLAGGASAVYVEDLSRDPAALRAAVAAELSQAFAGLDADRDIEVVHVEAWTRARPLARGAWSAGVVGTRSEDLDALARPLTALRLAGEGTCRLMHSTAHGAIVSGARVAAALLLERGLPLDAKAWPLFDEGLRSLCDVFPVSWRRRHRRRRNCKLLFPRPVAAVPSLVQGWTALRPADRRRWQALGWSSLSWDHQGAPIPPVMWEKWDSLPWRAYIAALKLGFTEQSWIEATQDMPWFVVCRRRPANFVPWDAMEDLVRAQWTRLGWNRTSWDLQVSPNFPYKKWPALPRELQAAFLKLGFRQGVW